MKVEVSAAHHHLALREVEVLLEAVESVVRHLAVVVEPCWDARFSQHQVVANLLRYVAAEVFTDAQVGVTRHFYAPCAIHFVAGVEGLEVGPYYVVGEDYVAQSVFCLRQRHEARQLCDGEFHHGEVGVVRHVAAARAGE